MCLNCSPDELSDCAFSGDEHHPDDWPSDARREDYPDALPEPHGWDSDKGKPLDTNDRSYNPYQGSRSVTDGRCGAPLTAHIQRYGEPRYCTRLTEDTFVDDGSQFCRVHKNRQPMIERASDVFSHGLYSKTIRHVFERLEPWQQLALLAWYDSYLQESVYDFGPDFDTESIDFSDAEDEDLPLEIASMVVEGDDRTIDVGVPVPSEHRNRGYALYRAAVMDVKAGLAERAIFGSSGDTAAMERETTVSVTEEGREITDMDEHHLNLPLSRLDGDRKELLEFGGVIVSEDQDSIDVNVDSPDELVVDLEPSDQTTTGSANPVEQSMQSEQ